MVIGKRNNMCVNIKNYTFLALKYTYLCNFNPFEVVGRGSEAQLQVG